MQPLAHRLHQTVRPALKTLGGRICLRFDWSGERQHNAVIRLSGHFMQLTKRR